MIIYFGANTSEAVSFNRQPISGLFIAVVLAKLVVTQISGVAGSDRQSQVSVRCKQ
jgi:hypothetical protein